VTFGRNGHSPADSVEINGGTWPSCGSSEPTYYTESKTFSKGIELIPPESDESLSSYVEPGYRIKGAFKIFLSGTNGQIGITTYEGTGYKQEVKSWPANGLLYVENNGACAFKFSLSENDYVTKAKVKEEEKCATAYVEGSYAQSLTIASAGNVILSGNVYPTSVSGKLGSKPTGAATLGLIATEYVRVYHPCTGGTNQKAGAGSPYYENEYINEPFIYAAILSTSHSFVVDDFNCGAKMGKLNVYGAIAQKFRGPVGVVGGAGYAKEYTYDQRLVTEEPPYFLPPLKSGWKVSRVTSAKAG
jgi:hypothetical protein